jgi:hypothetical protein
MASLSRRAQSSLLAAVLLLWTACRTAAPTATAFLPDPLSAPIAGTPLTEAQLKFARAAMTAAAKGDLARMRKRLAKLPAAHPVRELIELEARYTRGEAVAEPAVELAGSAKSYAAAWSLATLALRREGRDEEALGTARRAFELRRDDDTLRAVSTLEGELVARGVAEAGALLGRGEAAAAFSRAHRVLELVPTAGEARMIAVRAALASGQTPRAVELLPAIPDTPAGIEVKGRVAEALGQWELAAQLYETLPEDHPGRCELLLEAREQWRLSLAPPHLDRALKEPALTRRGLAAILVWEVPELAEKAAGPVPVFEDVVGLAEGRDIVVAVRAGVLVGDSIARRFGPKRLITDREFLACLNRLADVLGAAPSRWCGGQEVGGECLARPATLDGRTVAELVRSVAGQEGSQCTRP